MKQVLRIHSAALAIHPARLTPFTRANLATRGLIPPQFLTAGLLPTRLFPTHIIPAGLSRAALPTGALIRLEVTPRRALAFDGPFVTGAFLRIEELRQGGKRQPAQGSAKRT